MAPFMTSAAALALAGIVAGQVVVTPQAGTYSYDAAQPNAINLITTNATAAALASPATPENPPSPLKINLANNLSNAKGQVYAYVTGKDSAGKPFFLGSDGQPIFITASSTTPQPITQDIGIKVASFGNSGSVTLNNYIDSGRIYYSDGEISWASVLDDGGHNTIVGPSFTNPSDPNANTNYGWTEFTWNDSEIFVNLSYVDFVGLPAAQQLESSDGTCNVKGLPTDGVSKVCSGLKDQASKDGEKWGESCQADSDGNVLRVLAPLHVREVPNQTDFLDGYYDSYIDSVWGNFTSRSLSVDYSGNTITGQTQGDQLVFDSNAGSFDKPNFVALFGCNDGPFANSPNERGRVIAVLCAGLHRTSLLMSDDQPNGVSEDKYYTVDPTNHYARIVHANEVDGRGYTFAFDDVVPDGGVDTSGACQAGSPQTLTITIGGPQ